MPDELTTPSIVLCPGQGAQHVGMAKAWAERHPVAAERLSEADQILGIELSKLCVEGPAEQLDRTDTAQAAIYASSVACYDTLRQTGLVEQISATAGLSLGEFTALHIAGAFSFADGLRLVRLRGQAMQDAAEASDGGMVALIGADEQQARSLCEQAVDSGQVLVPANFNCPGQIVISGSQAACDKAVRLASDMGLRATALTVAGAFHSPLMQPAADRLAEALDQVDWQTPAVPVVANVTARPHENHLDAIKQRLVDQLTKPVRWGESMAWMMDNVSGRYVELAPGKVLSGLMRRINRKTRVANFAEPAD